MQWRQAVRSFHSLRELSTMIEEKPWKNFVQEYMEYFSFSYFLLLFLQDVHYLTHFSCVFFFFFETGQCDSRGKSGINIQNSTTNKSKHICRYSSRLKKKILAVSNIWELHKRHLLPAMFYFVWAVHCSSCLSFVIIVCLHESFVKTSSVSSPPNSFLQQASEWSMYDLLED